MTFRLLIVLLMLCVAIHAQLVAQSVEAPSGMFKDLSSQTAGDALLISGKQFFIDDYIIGELDGAKKTLHQPVRHPDNPLIVPDRPWEGRLGFGSVIYDEEEGFYKLWYDIRSPDDDHGESRALCYATSPDGVAWRKPVTTPWRATDKHNMVFGADVEFNRAVVFKDPADVDGEHRYKITYSAYRDGPRSGAATSVAYSPDGIDWTPEPVNPINSLSGIPGCSFWDARLGRYVAYFCGGPPNAPLISRSESEDFVHWSPQTNVLRANASDRVFNARLCQMQVLPYEGVYFGLLSTHYGENLQPSPEQGIAWRDKLNVQLAFSRNGYTWMRVIGEASHSNVDAGTAQPFAYIRKHDLTEAVFLPFGEHEDDWDGGSIIPLHMPLVFDDVIRIYYAGTSRRHRAPGHGAAVSTDGIGLATLRLDRFLAIEAGPNEATLTTKPLIFIGDALEMNADAAGGSVVVEALDADGNAIDGFTRGDCEPIITDDVRHLLEWNGSSNAQLLQARPIRLKFYLRNAKLFSFTSRIVHNHYIPSYP